MILADGIFALGIAFFLTILFAVLGRRARSYAGILVFFTVIFLAAWAGGVWIGPAAHRLLGVYWLAFVVAGLVFALIQEAMAAPSRRAAPKEGLEAIEAKEGRELARIFNIFLLVLLVLFIAAIVIGYIHRSR